MYEQKKETTYQKRNELSVDEILCEFIENEVLPGLNIDPVIFWENFSLILNNFSDKNKNLLIKREEIQNKIDQWYLSNHGKVDDDKHLKFLRDIGYLVSDTKDFKITTDKVDDEIALIAGPQLVVPVKNARYAINASNARWGSLYDALYGSDIIPKTEKKELAYDPLRGMEVIKFVRSHLDKIIPLLEGSHSNATRYLIKNEELVIKLNDKETSLLKKNQFVGFTGSEENPNSILFIKNNLHIEILFNKKGIVGSNDSAGIQDVQIESAITVIQDFEDSVAAVDAEEKTCVYRNWLGLMRGDLKSEFQKGKNKIIRKLNSERSYKNPNGKTFSISGRSLLLARNVGHLMMTNAILNKEDLPIPEGIMDAIITVTICLYDLRKKTEEKNSKFKNIYIVKPKMHGPEEVAFTCDLFKMIEEVLNLPSNTIKLGIMDEERRTSINLKACIYEARERVIFINTGFLDRTGDEIHTSMEAGPMLPKEKIKDSEWIKAYELSNVELGLSCGFIGKAQIGKGMWAMPDKMKLMFETKDSHLKSGANCAWVPSPTAATLHAMHYHITNVKDVQNTMLQKINTDSINKYRKHLVRPPLLKKSKLTKKDIKAQLDNNIQGILGYVVRWINDGIGCSKVPNIENIGLMEDRATLRISSQLLSNWLYHKICTENDIYDSLKRMVLVVDKQNKDDINYKCMGNDIENDIAFKAASLLIFEGRHQPSGYTEPILHEMRVKKKIIEKL